MSTNLPTKLKKNKLIFYCKTSKKKLEEYKKAIKLKDNQLV